MFTAVWAKNKTLIYYSATAFALILLLSRPAFLIFAKFTYLTFAPVTHNKRLALFNPY